METGLLENAYTPILGFVPACTTLAAVLPKASRAFFASRTTPLFPFAPCKSSLVWGAHNSFIFLFFYIQGRQRCRIASYLCKF